MTLVNGLKSPFHLNGLSVGNQRNYRLSCLNTGGWGWGWGVLDRFFLDNNVWAERLKGRNLKNWWNMCPASYPSYSYDSGINIFISFFRKCISQVFKLSLWYCSPKYNIMCLCYDTEQGKSYKEKGHVGINNNNFMIWGLNLKICTCFSDCTLLKTSISKKKCFSIIAWIYSES